MNYNDMKTNILELETSYLLEIELPGFTKEDIKVFMKDNYLNVTAKRNEEKNQNVKYLHQERGKGNFERRFALSKHISKEGIEASYVNGILSVKLEKAPITDGLIQIA